MTVGDRYLLLVSRVPSAVSVRNHLELFDKRLRHLSSAVLVLDDLILCTPRSPGNFVHKVHFETLRQHRFVFCSVMAGRGRLILYWIGPQHRLHLAAQHSVCEHQLMDLVKTGSAEFLSPVYVNQIYRVRLVLA